MYKLYWSPGSAAMAPHAMLIEIGAPYEAIKIDDSKNEQRGAEYMRQRRAASPGIISRRI